MPTKPKVETVTITLDDREVEARKGEMLIAAAERAGTYVPRFCWHPRMKAVGMCRMCVVDVQGPRGWGLVPACYIPVAPGMVVNTQSPRVKKAQDGILEFLLINHPLDCPVCDKGGECPLQDHTLAFGPGESRMEEEKRHFEKPVPISDLVLLDRERCIMCARCTRFADEVAGDPFIQIIDRGNESQINVFPDDPFASYFSGNTVQICPVGALTASPYRFKARPWDLDQVESTCTACAVGCRVALQSSANRLTRMLGIDSELVNHGWLCDKGRFGIGAVNSENRLTTPLVRRDGDLVETTWGEALTRPPQGWRPPGISTVPTRWPCWAAPGWPTRTPTPGPSWPRACWAPTTSTASWATACRPRSSSACRGPRSTTRPGPTRWCSSGPTSGRSCPSSSCACARRRPRTASASSS